MLCCLTTRLARYSPGCSRRSAHGGTDTNWRAMCRFRPTFVGVMRWRKKLPPTLAISCRFATWQELFRQRK